VPIFGPWTWSSLRPFLMARDLGVSARRPLYLDANLPFLSSVDSRVLINPTAQRTP